MKPRTIAIGIATIVFALFAVAAAGAAIDASDGSIDAFDDKKWSATGGDGVRDANSADPTIAIPTTLQAKRAAYDFGTSFFKGDSTVCPSMVKIHDQAVEYIQLDLDATGFLKEVQVTANGWITDAAKSAGHTTQSRFAVSGWWDQLARACPEALFDPAITGRP